MSNKLDKLIVLDVESTCWDMDSKERIQESEIIEIGVCVLDLHSLARVENESILVKPFKSAINDFCTKLTTLTPALIEEKGISFADACLLLRNKYKVHHRLWASWGDYDRKQFERQCRRTSNDAQYPFGPTHLNVKNLFAITMGLTREVGMDEALKILDMELEGTHHRGVDDACNIAKIACSLLECARYTKGKLSSCISTLDSV